MRVILRTDVESVGNKGDVIDVADGFARNYLLPKGWAMKASAGSEAQAERMRRSRNIKDAADRGAAEDIATRLVPTTITIEARVGSEGRLFGSVTANDIAAAVKSAGGPILDRRRIELDGHIKSTGAHRITVRIHPDVSAQFAVTVVAS